MSEQTMEAPQVEAPAETEASESIAVEQPAVEAYDDLLSAYDAVMVENQQPDDEEFEGTGDDGLEETHDDETEKSLEPENVEGWNWQEFASNQIPLKIDGEEVSVPLEELRNGYMRQADYTRKTQEVAEVQKLAEWAREFQDRFSQDPHGMVRMLSAALGEPDGEYEEPDPFGDIIANDPELAPFAQTIQQQQQMIAELRSELSALGGKTIRTESEIQLQKNVELVRQEIQQVKARYDDFDEMQVLPIAAETGMDLTTSYFIWKGNQAANSSQPAVQQKSEPAPTKKVSSEKKRATQPVTNSRFSGEPSTDGEQYDTFAELFEIVARTEN
jgi:hypothetical protein